MSLLRSRVIRKQQRGDEFQRWELPSVEDANATVAGVIDDDAAAVEVGEDVIENVPKWPTADELAAIHTQAYDEGLASGHKQGLEEGRIKGQEQAYAETRRDWDERCRQLHAIADALARPLAGIEPEVEATTVELIVLIAKQLVRRELRTSPDEVVAVVREAMTVLPLTVRHPRIYLHPEDLDLVRNALGLHEGHNEWSLHSDPLLTRGGCVVETHASRIDATVEARLAATVARFLGKERHNDGAA